MNAFKYHGVETENAQSIHDSDQQYLISDGSPAAETLLASSNVAFNSTGRSMASLAYPGWMPDSSCFVCYSCDRPFSILRRRHHCRQCGQVFCARNILSSGRACDYCANLATTAAHLSCRRPPANIAVDNVIKQPEIDRIHDRLQSITNLAISETMSSEVRSCAIDLAIQATSSLVVRPDLGENRDPRCYVQICQDSASDSSFCMFGCVISKNVAHRRMRTLVKNPRVLLLQGGIEYDRNPGRLTSIGSILEGEKIFIGIIIEKIMLHKPDVLLTHRSVSGHALSLLLDRDVTCLVNVPQDDLKRVARCTGAAILESIDQTEGALGTCSLFRTHRSSQLSLCLFQGCKPSAGSTIVLNGPSAPLDLLSLMIVQAYNIRCEIALEKDFGLNYHVQDDNTSSASCSVIASKKWYLDSILVADSWPCYRQQKVVQFYEQGDLTLREFLYESALTSYFSCSDCRRVPLQHSVVFENGDARVSLQIKQSPQPILPDIMTWMTCSLCGGGSVMCCPVMPLSLSAMQISFYRFIHLMLSENPGCCQFCQHEVRAHHTRWFSVKSLTLMVVCSRRNVYSICYNLMLNNLPADEHANPSSCLDFSISAMTCLNEFRAFAKLQVDVERCRDELVEYLHRQPFSLRDLIRTRFKLLHQASIWNEILKDSSLAPVSISSINGDSIPVNIALALVSNAHFSLVQYLDHDRRACVDALLDGSGEAQVSVSNLSSDCSCVIYFPVQSAAIRRLTIGDDRQDHEFILSLNEVGEWIATGGKSDATFNKSRDNRLVIKIVRKRDVNVFRQIGAEYYRHLGTALAQDRASIMTPILGVYRVTVGNSQKHLVVTPNLFYGMQQVDKVFDLKGSSRIYRAVEAPDDATFQLSQADLGENSQRETETLLDGNFLSYTKGIPLALSPLSAAVLLQTLKIDTAFLSSKSIVDYSVLIGLDTKNQQIAVAIIDYLRVYSLDAMLETQVKSLGMLAGRPMPTVIPPHDYRKRFCRALSTYFGLP